MLSDKEINDLISEQFVGYCVHELKYSDGYMQCQKCGELYAAAYVPNSDIDWINDPKYFFKLLNKLTDMKLEWALYSVNDKTYEVEITDPNLRQHHCFETGDDRVGYADDTIMGRTICLAILDMKGIDVHGC